MNGPNDLDDGWAELARELGLEGQTPTPAPTSRGGEPAPDDLEDELEELTEETADEPDADEFSAGDEPDGDPDADDGDSSEEGEDAEGDADGEAAPGEPGEPKKKRRRRRRRGKKKPGDVAEPVPGGVADADESDDDEPEAATDADESEDSDDDAPPADGLMEEEGATPAATRELIANWDVPSWETIVTTLLFRPPGNR